MKFTGSLARGYLAGFVLILVSLAVIVYLYNDSLPNKIRAAERKAHAFCGAIAVGSDISIAVARAKDEGVFWGSKQGYTFYFPATPFDKAVCEVTVDQEGKVATKGTEMEFD